MTFLLTISIFSGDEPQPDLVETYQSETAARAAMQAAIDEMNADGIPGCAEVSKSMGGDRCPAFIEVLMSDAALAMGEAMPEECPE